MINLSASDQREAWRLALRHDNGNACAFSSLSCKIGLLVFLIAGGLLPLGAVAVVVAVARAVIHG